MSDECGRRRDEFLAGGAGAVVTSWDDGHIWDVCTVHLLNRYGIKGTFGIPTGCLSDDAGERDAPNNGSFLARADIQTLYEGHEIASHSHLHPNHLPRFAKQNKEAIAADIRQSKRVLRELLGREVRGFIYPHGVVSEDAMQVLREEGFAYARTTRTICDEERLDKPERDDRWAWGVTCQINSFCIDDQEVHRERFARAREERSVFHLWGHSGDMWWQDEQRPKDKILPSPEAWFRCHKFFQSIGPGQNPDMWYCTIEELFEAWFPGS